MPGGGSGMEGYLILLFVAIALFFLFIIGVIKFIEVLTKDDP